MKSTYQVLRDGLTDDRIRSIKDAAANEGDIYLMGVCDGAMCRDEESIHQLVLMLLLENTASSLTDKDLDSIQQKTEKLAEVARDLKESRQEVERLETAYNELSAHLLFLLQKTD